jgi:hypothetical protein
MRWPFHQSCAAHELGQCDRQALAAGDIHEPQRLAGSGLSPHRAAGESCCALPRTSLRLHIYIVSYIYRMPTSSSIPAFHFFSYFTERLAVLVPQDLT